MNIQKIIGNKKGISLIMLVITVIMMAIIVSFAVFSSRNVTPESKLAAAYSSLKAIKDACDNAVNLIEINPDEYNEYYFFGQNIKSLIDEENLTDLLKNCGLGKETNPILEISDRTYLIKNSESESDLRKLERLELKGVSSTYIVDLENEKYYLLNGVKRLDGESVYEYKDLLKAYNLLID